MFSEREISKLTNLVNLETRPEDILEGPELKIISSIQLIKDSIFVPKHGKESKTIIIKKLFLPDFEITNFVNSIYNVVKPPFEIRIGVSFVAHDPSDDKLLYFFAIRNRPLNSDIRTLSDKTDLKNLLDFVGSFSRKELLNHTFALNNALNKRDFHGSGFRPKKLVLSVFWITKYERSGTD